MLLNLLTRGLEVYLTKGLPGVKESVLRKLNGPREPLCDYWTEYLSWLTYANAGMLARGNVECMDYAIRNLPSVAPIVEIGSFCGLSANVMTYLKQRHNATNRLITCDKWQFENADGGGMVGDSKFVTHAEYKQFVKDSFLRNARMFSRDDLPYTIEMLSDEFFAAWSAAQSCHDVFGRPVTLGGPISFCYIDGNHTYEFAKRDFDNCDQYLEPAGFVLFDDSGDGSDWEVRKLVREVQAAGRYELITKNPNYFFRKKRC
jgi:hypothetical protein